MEDRPELRPKNGENVILLGVRVDDTTARAQTLMPPDAARLCRDSCELNVLTVERKWQRDLTIGVASHVTASNVMNLTVIDSSANDGCLR